MRDNEVRLSQVYVVPTGSTVHNHAPNSADDPLPSFDLIITGEAGDDINSSGSAYTLSYSAFDFSAGANVGGAFSAALPQTFGSTTYWTTVTPDDYVTTQRFTIPRQAGLSGHILQYFATLISHKGDIVSFVQSEPFILV